MSDALAQALACEGVMQIDPSEVAPGDFMYRVIAPDGGVPAGWTLLATGLIWRTADGHETPWPAADFAVRPIRGWPDV